MAQTKNIRTGVAVLMSAVGFSCAHASAEEAIKIAGYVQGTKGNKLSLERASKPVTLKAGVPVLEGDKILISGDSKIVIISNAPERSGTFDAKDSPLEFPVKPPPSNDILSTLIAIFKNLNVDGEKLNHPPAVVAQVDSKGVGTCDQDAKKADLARTRVLSNPNQFVDKSSSKLVFMWSGGSAPYRVSYEYLGKWYYFNDFGGCANFIETSPPQLFYQGGKGHIKVTDDNSNEVDWVVTINPSPSAPLTNSDDTLYQRLDAVLQDLAIPNTQHAVQDLSELQSIQTKNFLAWRVLQGYYSNDWEPTAPAAEKK